MCQLFGYVTWGFCGKQACLQRVLEVMFLLSFRRQNKARGRRIQPAAEADSNQVQDSVLSTEFRSLLN